MGFFGDIGKGISTGFSGALPLVADFLTGGGYSTGQANEQNTALNRENRDWSQSMSNSAYQRAVADMRAAGLNPMLAYQQGGASTPQNSAPSIAPAKMGAGLATTAKSAIELIGAQNNQKADTILKAESADTEKSKRALNSAQGAKALADATESQERTKNYPVERQNIWSQKSSTDAQIPGHHARSDSSKMETDLQRQRQGWDKNLQKVDAVIERAAKLFSPLNSAKSFLQNSNQNTNNGKYNPNQDVRDTMNSKHKNSPFRRK